MTYRAVIALALCGACTPNAPVAPVPPTGLDAGPSPSRTVTGLYWGRWNDVPEGVRVALWLDADGTRVRGSWDLPPWHGEVSGTRRGDVLTTGWHETGTVALTQSRDRAVTLRMDTATGALRGGSPTGTPGDGGTDPVGTVDLVPAGHASPVLRPGLWLGRWTGLPAGMAVETVLDQDPDGRWRAAYRYQGREGSFVGDTQPDGSLAIQWQEVSSRDAVALGHGLLHPTVFGLRGTYGIGAELQGTGEWSLEPLAAP